LGLGGCNERRKSASCSFFDSAPDSNPQLLIDYDATAANIRKALQDTLDAATNNDTVVFFFSGHGSSKSFRRPLMEWRPFIWLRHRGAGEGTLFLAIHELFDHGFIVLGCKVARPKRHGIEDQHVPDFMLPGFSWRWQSQSKLGESTREKRSDLVFGESSITAQTVFHLPLADKGYRDRGMAQSSRNQPDASPRERAISRAPSPDFAKYDNGWTMSRH
jgi:hypothetical protein